MFSEQILKELQEKGVSLSRMDTLSVNDLKALLNDQEKAVKLSNEIEKLRRKREEKWISNLVDFPHNDY